MTQRTQFDRAYTTGVTTSGQPEGTPFFNFADLKLQIQGPSGVVDLLPVRLHSDQADYAGGEMIYHEGNLYKASGPITAGPFTPGEWTLLSYDNFSVVTGDIDWDFTITYGTGDKIDQILYTNGALQVRVTLTYTVDELIETISYETSSNSGVDWTAARVLTVSYDPTTELVTSATWS